LVTPLTGTDLAAGTVYTVTFDFMSFGFTSDGENAADRNSNQIIRLELEGNDRFDVKILYNSSTWI
jgi:hypothetical protein